MDKQLSTSLLCFIRRSHDKLVKGDLVHLSAYCRLVYQYSQHHLVTSDRLRLRDEVAYTPSRASSNLPKSLVDSKDGVRNKRCRSSANAGGYVNHFMAWIYDANSGVILTAQHSSLRY